MGEFSMFSSTPSSSYHFNNSIASIISVWSPEFGWWLEKRIRTMDGFATPTGVVTKRA